MKNINSINYIINNCIIIVSVYIYKLCTYIDINCIEEKERYNYIYVCISCSHIIKMLTNRNRYTIIHIRIIMEMRLLVLLKYGIRNMRCYDIYENLVCVCPYSEEVYKIFFIGLKMEYLAC